MIQTKIRDLALTDYETVFSKMKEFTLSRSADTSDEIWLTEHFPVFTQGQAGKTEHILARGSIPVVQTDRGGQVTYHGPGQIVGYLMFDLKRMKLSVRDLVSGIEVAIAGLLEDYGIQSHFRSDAPGVYVGDKKISALGLRVRQGCSYHGFSLNVDMDLEPFTRINPCGLTDIGITQLADLGGPSDLKIVAEHLLKKLTMAYDLNLHK